MSEQNPKQNIIRFPLSRRERRQRLLDSKDARIRTTALLRMLCGWALVLGTALFLIANYRIFTPTSLRTLGSYIAAGIRSHDGDITTINYENETFSDGALFESGLAYADSDALFLSRAGSMTTLRYSLGYSDPAVESSTNYVLVYDRGGVKAALVGSAGAVAELKLESTILNGSIGPKRPFRAHHQRARLPYRRCRLRHRRKRGFQIPRFGILYCIRCALAGLQYARHSRLPAERRNARIPCAVL